MEVAFADVEAELAACDGCQVQKVINEACLELDVVLHVQKFLADGWRDSVVGQQGSDGQDYGRQGRAQFVREGGQELLFGGECTFYRLLRLHLRGEIVDDREQERAVGDAERAGGDVDIADGAIRPAMLEEPASGAVEGFLHALIHSGGGQRVEIGDRHPHEFFPGIAVEPAGGRIGVNDPAGLGVNQEHDQGVVFEEAAIPLLALKQAVLGETEAFVFAVSDGFLEGRSDRLMPEVCNQEQQ